MLDGFERYVYWAQFCQLSFVKLNYYFVVLYYNKMIINHIVQRREARRQRRAQWMISRCYGQPVQTTDIIIEEPVIQDVIVDEPVIIIPDDPIVIIPDTIVVEEAIIPVKPIDEAAEELRKLLILHQTIKKLSSKKKVI